MKKLVLIPLLLQIFTAFSQNAFPIVSANYGSAAIYADSADHWLVSPVHVSWNWTEPSDR